MNKVSQLVKTFDDFLESFSKWGVLVCIFFILILSLIVIVYRWFDGAPHWIDPLIRHLVFLSAFFGGSLATKSNQHIKVDILEHLLKKKNKHLQFYLNKLVTLVTLIAVLLLAKSSYEYIEVEKMVGKVAFFGLHSSVLVTLVPFGFLLIGLRLVGRLFLNLEDLGLNEELEKENA